MSKNTTLEKIAHGWAHLEPAIIGYVAANIPFAARGMHGNAKTTVAKAIGLAMTDILVDKENKKEHDDGIRYFSCDKASIIALAGIPDANQTRDTGSLQFIPSRSTVLGPDVVGIILDELGRAPKEVQNFLLEIIEHKTIFGIPLHYKFLMATMNPETYKSSMKLDAALLDRFAGLLPIPDFTDIDSADAEAMMRINMSRVNDPEYEKNIAKELRVKIDATRTKYAELVKNEDTLARVSGYVGQLTSICQTRFASNSQENDVKLSGREISNLLWRSILAIAAYHMAVDNWQEGQSLVVAAQEVIDYGLILKHQLPEDLANIVRATHNDAKFILQATAKGEAGKILMAFAKAHSASSKIEFWRSNIDGIVKHVAAEDMTTMMEETLEKVQSLKPKKDDKSNQYEVDSLKMQAELFAISRGKKELSGAVDRIEGSMLCKLIQVLRDKNSRVNDPSNVVAFGGAKIAANNIVDIIVAMSDKGIRN